MGIHVRNTYKRYNKRYNDTYKPQSFTAFISNNVHFRFYGNTKIKKIIENKKYLMSILQFFIFILTNWFTNRYTIDIAFGFAGAKHFYKNPSIFFGPSCVTDHKQLFPDTV